MVFILSDDGRDGPFPAAEGAFERYNEYLTKKKGSSRRVRSNSRLPTGSTVRATVAVRAMHGRNPSMSRRRLNAKRSCSISLRLFGAYHDGHIEITDPKVLRSVHPIRFVLH